MHNDFSVDVIVKEVLVGGFDVVYLFLKEMPVGDLLKYPGRQWIGIPPSRFFFSGFIEPGPVTILFVIVFALRDPAALADVRKTESPAVAQISLIKLRNACL